MRGLYRFRAAPELPKGAPRATILAGGSIMQQALRAQTILAERFGVAAEVWSATSYQLLRNEALEVDRWNLLHPAEAPRTPARQRAAGRGRGPRAHRGRQRLDPGVAGHDRRWVPGSAWTSLGTDGFGRSDTREALRRFFGIDAAHIAAAVLSELARCGQVPAETAAAGIAELGIDPEAPFSLRH